MNCIFTKVIHKRQHTDKLYMGLSRKKIANSEIKKNNMTADIKNSLDSKYFKILTSYEQTNTPILNAKIAFTHQPPQCKMKRITIQYNIVPINIRILKLLIFFENLPAL